MMRMNNSDSFAVLVSVLTASDRSRLRRLFQCLGLALLALALGACGNGGEAQLRELVQSQQGQIQRLGERLQRAEDVQAIERLQRAYGYYVDKNLWDQVVDLFAEQSSVELDQRGIFLNKEGARRMFLERMGGGKIGLDHGVLFNHIQVQGVIDVDAGGTAAKGRFRTIVQVSGFNGIEGFWSDGLYENEYVKEDGVWKFSKLKFWPTYYTPFHEGWDGRQIACINGDGTGMSPGADLPSTEGAGVYPNIYYPPFHYPNPVTGKEVDLSELNKKAIAETVWPECPGG